MQTPDNHSPEVHRLRQITRDLVALSTLPAIWGGLHPAGVIDSLANVLRSTLDLDLVYIRLANRDGNDVVEAVRGKRQRDAGISLPAARAALAAVLAQSDASQPAAIADPFDDSQTLRATVIRFGIAQDNGVIVAGSRRADFPAEHDRLLLGVGANQAAVVVRRQRTEQALERSETRFLEFADTAPAMLWVTEPDGYCSFLSRGWYEFTGQSENQGLGFGWIDAIHPDDRDRARQAFIDANAGKGEFVCEHRVLHADGSYRWVIDSGRPRWSPSGEFLGMVGNVLDITSRKQAKQELARVSAESERRKRLYETSLSNTPDLVYVFDHDHRFTYANDALLAMWGRSWEDAIGKTCLELGYEPWQAARHDQEIEQVKATKRPIRAEVPFAGTAGRRIYDYIIVPVFGPDGEVEAIAGTARDVTERKQSEQDMARLLRKEKQRTSILASVALASKSLNTELSADTIARVLAQEARNIVGAHCATVRLDSLAHDGRDIRAVSQSDQYGVTDNAKPQQHPDGAAMFAEVERTHRPMRVNRQVDATHAPVQGGIAVPLIGHGGKHLGLVWLLDKCDGDFTDDDEAILVQLAAIAAAGIENARLYERVRDQDRRKDEFLATLAHELRNPLAPIRTGLALMKLVPSLEATIKPREIMERQVDHMVRLIDDLLDVSRITSGKVQLKIERLDARAVLESALELSRPIIEENRHGLFVSIPKEALLLDADATRITQVVSNLLNNAAKYTPPGGRIELCAAADGKEVLIRVQDNGVGLAQETLPRLFELFSQVGKTLDRSQGGLGIGLALVRRLVEMHSGSVTAESAGLGHGSTFTVRLPLARAHVVAEQSAHEQNPPPASIARRILIVDDNVDAAEMIAMLLTMSGHTVSTVYNGADALKSVETARPHIVFLDIGLPGISGYEVAQQLRANPDMQDMVLVALTGWGTEDDRRQALHAGFDHHLTKPVKIEKLQQILAEFEEPGIRHMAKE